MRCIILVSQPVLPHRLIRINIKLNFIVNNYNYLLNILTDTLKYIIIII